MHTLYRYTLCRTSETDYQTLDDDVRLYYIINAIYVHVCTICTCHFKRMYTEEHATLFEQYL